MLSVFRQRADLCTVHTAAECTVFAFRAFQSSAAKGLDNFSFTTNDCLKASRLGFSNTSEHSCKSNPNRTCGGTISINVIQDPDPPVVHHFISGSCQDDQSYVDINGRPCSHWAEHPEHCYTGRPGYMPKDLEDVLHKCQKACGVCVASSSGMQEIVMEALDPDGELDTTFRIHTITGRGTAYQILPNASVGEIIHPPATIHFVRMRNVLSVGNILYESEELGEAGEVTQAVGHFLFMPDPGTSGDLFVTFAAEDRHGLTSGVHNITAGYGGPQQVSAAKTQSPPNDRGASGSKRGAMPLARIAEPAQ
ncbi:hypothetical protein CYMTET_30253 [Cymbomonas tetramitiformis]|uniref:Uncharacterized protein n=1 Tax=Cymbomonas tetramitiformis TaxID=36881 RepID=A0AAE0KUC0_9CHLO|nr:hypothetical protein CYMTET_30253 [Cymbomonas tetramitiformis]